MSNTSGGHATRRSRKQRYEEGATEERQSQVRENALEYCVATECFSPYGRTAGGQEIVITVTTRPEELDEFEDDAADARLVEARRGEPSVTHEDFKARLRADGLL